MEKIASGSTHEGSLGGQHSGDHIKGHATGTTGIESDASVIADKSSALAIESSTTGDFAADKK